MSLLPVMALFAGEIRLNNQHKNQLSLLENTYEGLILKHTVHQLNTKLIKTDKGSFTLLQLEGCAYTMQTGYPKLPVRRELIEIPLGAEVHIQINDASYTDISLTDMGIESPLIPAQPPVVKDGRPVPPLVVNPQAYQSNTFAPVSLTGFEDLGMMRGIRLGRIDIYPVQYNPVTHTLRIYDYLEIAVSFLHSDLESTFRFKVRNDNPYFHGINRMILNYKEIKKGAKDTISRYPIKYVIVSPPMFQSALQALVSWKKKKGFQVVEAYTSNPNVGSTTTSIKNYLQGLYLNATAADPAPTFILLVGDLAQMPSFTGSNGHKADLYYAEYTGDYFPEAFIGRFSAENESQLGPQIAKTLQYEQYLMPDPSFLDEVVMIAGVDANFGPTHGNGQINYGTSTYFNAAHGLTSHTYLYPASGSSSAQIIQNVSNGVGYANYTAHGGSDGWSDPSFSVSDVHTLQNAGKYPLMVGNCCLTNKFDEPVCFGEALLRADNKGALGYIGGSNVTYWDEDFYFGVGVRSITANPVWNASEQMGAYDVMFHDHGEPFSQWYTSMSQMMFAGNMAVAVGAPSSTEYYYEVYHLMGDPSLMVYFSVPPVNNVSYNNLMPLAVSTFTVNAAPYSYVAISQGNVLHGAALADSLGVANVVLDPITMPGYATIVVTGQNLQPFIDSIPVASPAGPYVLLNQFTLSDQTGNNNGLPDYNETISLGIDLKNWGLSTATGVSATLSTADTSVNITDNSQNWGNISSGSQSLQTNAFTFTVSDDVPDQHQVVFDLLIQDNAGHTWTGLIKIILNAPEFTVTSLIVHDITGGNGNGKLDPGETVELEVHFLNNGHAASGVLTADLNTLSPLLNLNTTTVSLPSVNAGGTSSAIFTGTVSSSAQTGDYVALDFSVVSGFYQASRSFNLGVGLFVEDWETGNWWNYNWQLTGSNAPWAISTENPYEGNYCVKSGAINNNQSSSYWIKGTVLMADSISFFYRVSSEPDYDFLRFYIDNVKLAEWAGDIDWTRASFAAAAGERTFRWTYRKDNSQTGGQDCAWADFITFPPMSGLITGLSTEVAAGFGWEIYPNPAASRFQVRLSLDRSQAVQIQLYNPMGMLVSRIAGGEMLSAGEHTFNVPTETLSAGIYLIELVTGQVKQSKRIVIQ